MRIGDRCGKCRRADRPVWASLPATLASITQRVMSPVVREERKSGLRGPISVFDPIAEMDCVNAITGR
jgi:hypothetical protein